MGKGRWKGRTGREGEGKEMDTTADDRGCRLPRMPETGNTTDISEYTAGTGNVVIIRIIFLFWERASPFPRPLPHVVFDAITGTNPYY